MDEKIQQKAVDVDEILGKFSLFGRYHVSTGLMIVLMCIYMKFSMMSFVLITAPIEYSCKDNVNATCNSFNSTNICSEWIYEDENSFIAELNLACQEWKRTLIGTIHNFGYVVGLIFIGPLSDRVGRKKAIIITSVSSSISAVARSFSNSYWMYLSLEFMEALLGNTFSPIFMLLVEIVSTEKRVSFLILNTMGYAVGGLVLTLLTWLFPYWRTCLRVIYAPALLFFLYHFFLDESPRWLLANGRKQEALVIIKKAAKINKVDLDENILEKLHHEKVESVNFVKVLKSTFRSRTLVSRFLVCVVWWTTATFVNYGLTINSVSLQGGKYLNFAIQFLLEIPGMFLNIFILNYLKRKYSLIIYFFIGAVFCLAQPFVPTNITWLPITLYMGGKLMSMFYLETTYLFTSELFPTYTRNSMHALCSSIGRIGSVIAPQTPLLVMGNHMTVYWSGLPSLVFGGISLFASAVTFLVPDTAHDYLPDTVRQAERIGIKKNEKNMAINNYSYCSYGNFDTNSIIQRINSTKL